MLSKEQYEQFKPYREALALYESSGCQEWVGGSVIYGIYDGITGGETKTGCPSCMSATLIGALNMVKRYEERL